MLAQTLSNPFHRSLLSLALLGGLVFSIVSLPPPEASAQGTLSFADIWNGLPPNSGGHGAAFADADGDGLSDFYVTFIKNTSTAPDFFFRNTGVGFAEEGSCVASPTSTTAAATALPGLTWTTTAITTC